MKILIVDDENGVRHNISQALHYFLRAKSYVSSTAIHAKKKFTEELNNGAFNIIIIDYKLNGKSGLDLINHIRLYDKKVVLIVVSGYPEVEEECMEAGANAFLHKPLIMSELAEEIAFLTQEPVRGGLAWERHGVGRKYKN